MADSDCTRCSGTVTREWVAVHRRHHVFADQPGDPHSPVLFGIRRVLLQGYELYVAAAHDPKILANYGLGRHVGYRSFEVPNAATNIVPWGVLIAGEELHNNHHAFPTSPRFSVQRWEVDVGWLFICAFRTLGLARVGIPAPAPNIVRERTTLDADTVRALFTHRMYVLRDYRRRVIRPVFRELTRGESAAGLARASPQLLVRYPKLLDERARG